MRNNPKNNLSDDPDIDELLDLVTFINEQPARYLPLSDGLACPYCKGLYTDEIGSPEEGVKEMECQRCKGVFYFDCRMRRNDGI